MGWFRIVVDTNNFATFFSFGDGAGNDYILQTDADGTTLIAFTPGFAPITGSALPVGQWFHLTFRNQGAGATDMEAFLDGISDIVTTSSAAPTSSLWEIGQDPFDEPLNGNCADVKIWDDALSDAEILAEVNSWTPVRWDSLVGFYPLFTPSDVFELSGDGNNLTANGTLTQADNPPLGPAFSFDLPPVTVEAAAAGGSFHRRPHFNSQPWHRDRWRFD